MILEVQGKNIKGHYRSEVGDAAKQYELFGQIDTDNDKSAAIGWVVVWNNETGSSDAVTTWSGQVQIDDDGNERIVTTWLLTVETDEDDLWHSTLVGKDVFTRIIQSEEDQLHNLSKGIKSSSPKVR